LVLGLSGTFDFGMSKMQGVPADLAQAISEDRAGLLRSDVLRSLLFTVLSFGVLWLSSTRKIRSWMAIGGLIVLVLADLWIVNKRFINNESFDVLNYA